MTDPLSIRQKVGKNEIEICDRVYDRAIYIKLEQ